MVFEGAGDALLDRGQPMLWVGYGFRSDSAAAALVEKVLGCKTVALLPFETTITAQLPTMPPLLFVKYWNTALMFAPGAGTPDRKARRMATNATMVNSSR